MLIILRNIWEYFLNLPIFIKVDAPRMCQFLAWLLAFTAASTAVGPIHFIPQNVHYGVCGLCIVYLFLQGGITANGGFFALYFAMGVSALFCEYAVFKSVPRFILFIMVTLAVSPCIVSEASLKFRALLCRNLLIILIIASLGSFIAYFLGINYMHNAYTGTAGDVTDSGLFGGLFGHSMLLGPIAAITALAYFNIYQDKKDYLSIFLFLVAAAVTALSASRGSVIALAIPVAYSLFMMRNVDGMKKRIIWILIIATLASIPLSDRFTSGLKKKQETNEDSGGTFSSRTSKWNYRIEEFKSSPMWGVGFAAINPDIDMSFDKKTGVIEPGSSHLAVLSMTGLLGFVPYIGIIIFSFMAVRGDKDGASRFRRCALIAFMVHGIVEGYALAGGSPLCFLYWLFIGQCVDYKKMEELGWISDEKEYGYYDEEGNFIEYDDSIEYSEITEEGNQC